jgi:hypothetical protein
MKRINEKIWREIELGFGSGSKIRILIYLLLNHGSAFSKYALIKATGLRSPTVEKHLETLKELGWINENNFIPKTYQINNENETVKHISKFFNNLKFVL